MHRLLRHFRDALLIPNIACDLHEGWIHKRGVLARSWARRLAMDRADPEQVLAGLRQAAKLPFDQAANLARELAADAPAADAAQRDALTRALSQMPALIRRVLRLAGDRQRPPVCASDLLVFVPRRVPRLLPGYRLPGFGDLWVGEFLGGGGFAEVYAAHNLNIPGGRPWALKVSFHPEGRRLLRHEAWMNGLVRSRGCRFGVLPVRHSFLDSDPPALAYPAVDGFNLRELLEARHRGGRIPDPRWVAKLMRRVALVLGYLHRIGYAHRDIKPNNIMVGRWEEGPEDVVLLDLGISGPLTGLSEDDEPLGDETRRYIDRILIYSSSPIYASPEQKECRYEHGYTRAGDDIFSGAAIAIQSLTGDFDHRVDVVAWQPLLEKQGVPRQFIELLEKCVSRVAQQRPASGADLAGRLERLLRLPVWRPGAGGPVGP
jgi:hypothetical protein